MNVIAPIRTRRGGQAWRQTTFYPFAETAAHHGSHVLHASVRASLTETARYGAVADLNAVVTATPLEDNRISLAAFMVNRGASPLVVELKHHGFDDLRVVDFRSIHADDAGPRHDGASASAARPRAGTAPESLDGVTTLQLPPESWSVLRAEAAGALLT